MRDTFFAFTQAKNKNIVVQKLYLVWIILIYYIINNVWQ